jgi:hypothetical protein
MKRHCIKNCLAEQYNLRLYIFELDENKFHAEWHDISDYRDSDSKIFDNWDEAIFWLESKCFDFITSRLMYEISTGECAKQTLDVINRDGFVLEYNVDHSLSTNQNSAT